jgi:phospholipid/cholesterol/gamma-HCH transport system substrate-binding protein
MKPGIVPALVGLATYFAIAAIVAVSVGLYRGSFTPTAPVTVLSSRAGLVMNKDARVTMRGVEVGRVASIDVLPNGQTALHLAMDPSQLHLIPANVLVEIAPPTAFGAKYVQFMPPAEPSPQPIHAGQVLDARHVTIEINTVFEQLTALLSKIEPAKLNETLGAIAKALNGRGQKLGRALADLDEFLTTVDPSLPALSHDLAVAPDVLNAYADAAPDLIKTAANATRVSQTIVDEQHNLDALLISAIGLSDIGNDVVGTNRQALTDVLHLLVPTTDLTNRYNQGLNCGLAGLIPLASSPPLPFPGVVVSVSFTLGIERYRYPHDLPKVAATGGPQCQLLPRVPMEAHPPFVVMDVGSNPTQYGNQGILLNSDALKQMLYGPIDGPPRNTVQVGQPG